MERQMSTVHWQMDGNPFPILLADRMTVGSKQTCAPFDLTPQTYRADLPSTCSAGISGEVLCWAGRSAGGVLPVWKGSEGNKLWAFKTTWRYTVVWQTKCHPVYILLYILFIFFTVIHFSCLLSLISERRLSHFPNVICLRLGHEGLDVPQEKDSYSWVEMWFIMLVRPFMNQVLVLPIQGEKTDVPKCGSVWSPQW